MRAKRGGKQWRDLEVEWKRENNHAKNRLWASRSQIWLEVING